MDILMNTYRIHCALALIADEHVEANPKFSFEEIIDDSV